MYKRLLTIFGVLLVASLALAACQPATPETVVETVVVEKEGETVVETVVVTPEMEEEEEGAAGECCDNYRIGIFEEPVSLNYWNYLGPGSSVWTNYVLAGNAPSLFGLADKTFQFVPSLAADIPEPVENDDGTWTITVEMLEGPTWSDGEPITAQDYVFTFNTCKELKLTQNWPNQCTPNGLDADVVAVDDYTVEFTFNNQDPSLGNWQAGVALAPIMPEHYWGDVVEEARGFIADVEEPEMERPGDCNLEDEEPADQEACDAWAAYDEAFTNARQTLYEADAVEAPSGGGLTTDQWEAGAFVQRSARDDYFFEGTEVVEYTDDTWVQILPDGTERQYYGEAGGDEKLRYTGGPYSPSVIHSIYGSQDAAFLALSNAEVDYVLNPLGLSRGLKEQATKSESVVTYTNADYGMYYIAFNFNKQPMSDPAFRNAMAAVIDKEFVVNQVLAGQVFPMYSTMPPGNEYFYNPDVPTPNKDLSREERVNKAVEILTEAGWSWETEPAWNADANDVDPGQGLTMPNGEPMPELTILGPGPAYDPIRATFNQWITEWANELGMPVEAELTGFNTILGPVFQDADYDMYILGWSLGNPAFPDYYESFWHSRNCTAETGNFNTPCYKNDEYDAMVDEFMATADIERAQELVYQMQLKLQEDKPYIPLYYNQKVDLAQRRVDYPYTEALGGLEFVTGMQSDAQVLTSK